MREVSTLNPKAFTIVLGAGVSGLSAALTLLQRGHRITLLERGDVGAESSWAGGGILSPLLPWDYAGPVARLALRSMAQYADWVAGIESHSGIDAEYWRCGMRVVAPPNPEAALAWCATHGLAARIERDGDLVLGEVAQVRNPRLVRALAAAVRQLGGIVRTQCAATGVLTHAGRMTAVQTATETFPADAVVLAAGAWSGTGLAVLPGVPGVRPIRGQMLLFRLAPGALDTVIYRDGLYLIPRRDGHILVGSTLEDAGFDKSTDDATRLRLHAQATELLPALTDVQPLRHWAGLRPGSPDNIPVIDRHPDFDNVFINAGHYRYGVTMAPASAELLVDLMEGKAPALDPAPYSWAAALARRW